MDFAKAQENILEHVRVYRRHGLNLIPLTADGERISRVRWGQYHTEEKVPCHLLSRHFTSSRYLCGIAVICGVTSGGLECLDFDDGSVWYDWWDRLKERSKFLAMALSASSPQVTTPSGGWHIYYRCPDDMEGSKGLAWGEPYYATDKDGRVVLRRDIRIETRGNPSLAVLPGSAPGTHASGRDYVLRHGSWSHMLTVTPEERRLILEVSREFNLGPAPTPKAERKVFAPTRVLRLDGAVSPWEDFDRNGDWFDLLDKAGWTELGGDDETSLWKRPGKTDAGASASLGFCKGDEEVSLFHVFSTSAHPLEGGRTYSASAVFAHLFCGGDFRLATRSLSARGYGRSESVEEKLARIMTRNELA